MRPWIVFAGLNGAMAVAMAAVGAHGVDAGAQPLMERASLFQLIHATVLLGIDQLAREGKAGYRLAGALLLLGVVLFSGSLYWKALVGPLTIPLITPTGGMSLILGWLALAVCGLGKFRIR